MPIPPLAVGAGRQVVVAMHFSNVSYQYPIAVDSRGSAQAGKSYVSETGADGSWYDLGAGQGEDVGIRLRTSKQAGPTPDTTATGTRTATPTRTPTGELSAHSYLPLVLHAG